MANSLPGLAACASQLLLLLALCLHLLAAAGASQDCAWAKAAAPSAAPVARGWRRALAPQPMQPEDGAPLPGPRIIDVSVGLDDRTCKFGSSDGLGKGFRQLEASQARGDAYTSSLLHLSAHTGALLACLPGGAPAGLGSCIPWRVAHTYTHSRTHSPACRYPRGRAGALPCRGLCRARWGR